MKSVPGWQTSATPPTLPVCQTDGPTTVSVTMDAGLYGRVLELAAVHESGDVGRMIARLVRRQVDPETAAMMDHMEDD